MKTYLGISKLIAAIFIIVIPLQTIAQENEESAARINKIATISKGEIGQAINETSLAQRKRSTQNNWLNVKKKDELYFNDILKLDKDIWLRINIKNKSQNGSIALFPRDLKEPGKYQLKEEPFGSRSVGIDIQQGSAILQVVKDKINTTTGGLTTAVQSGSITRALFNVKSDGSGEIYLQQGHLLFPGNSKVPGLVKGQVAYFQNGQITKVFFPDVPMTNKFNDFIKFNNSTVWKKPFLKQPVVWIGAAIVGIGTALIITKPRASKEVTGTVNINWGGN